MPSVASSPTGSPSTWPARRRGRGPSGSGGSRRVSRSRRGGHAARLPGHRLRRVRQLLGHHRRRLRLHGPLLGGRAPQPGHGPGPGQRDHRLLPALLLLRRQPEHHGHRRSRPAPRGQPVRLGGRRADRHRRCVQPHLLGAGVPTGRVPGDGHVGCAAQQLLRPHHGGRGDGDPTTADLRHRRVDRIGLGRPRGARRQRPDHPHP